MSFDRSAHPEEEVGPTDTDEIATFVQTAFEGSCNFARAGARDGRTMAIR
jgi:hypothetical protein